MKKVFIIGGIAVFFSILLFTYIYQEGKKSKAQSTSQIKSIKANLKLTFQGILRDRPLDDKKMKVKVTLVDEPSLTEYPFTIDFTYQRDSGTWNSFIEISALDISKKYKFFIKGQKHLQKRICDADPKPSGETNTYQCSIGTISLKEGENNFDFKNIVLMSGDLPQQDGVVDSSDIAKIRQSLGKTDAGSLSVADLNLDGVVDTQDYSLAIDGLLIKNDETYQLSVTPTVTTSQSPTPTGPTPTGPTPTGPTPTLTITPTPVLSGSPTPSPTTAQQGIWGTSSVIGEGGKFIWTNIDTTGAFHLTWGNQDTRTIWYATCLGVGSCNKERVPTGEGNTYYPSFAFDSANKVYLVWEKKVSDQDYEVYFALYNGSSWSSPKKISNEPYAELASIAVSENGKIHVVYQSKQGTNAFIYYVSSNDGGTTWSSSSKIGDGLRPQIIATSNKIHVVWNGPSPSYGIYYRFLQGGDWSTPFTVSSGHEDQTPHMSADSTGNLHLVWGKYDTNKVSYAKLEGHVIKDLKDNLGGSLGLSLWPQVNVDQSGSIHIVFQGKQNEDAAWGIYYVKKNSGGSWENIKTISQTGSNQQVPSVYVRQSKGILGYTDGTKVWASFLQ